MSNERYDVLEEAGRGAMGIVYKAVDRETSEQVALKILKPELLLDESALHRFKNELRIARRITHRNVCRIYELISFQNRPSISMEFVEGETLRSLLKRLGSLTVKNAADISLQICGGLREAHLQGIVHRDLKPENLMIDRNGTVKIMDFGVARFLDQGTASTLGGFVGTPAYMAPEQVECGEVDQRADIYAFGLILYEMLTGSIVFHGDSPIKVAYKQVHETVTPPKVLEPSIPANIEVLILRCLEKDPNRRFQNVEELEAAFAECGYIPQRAAAREKTTQTSSHRQNTTFVMARNRARTLMLLVQALYLGIYGAALVYLDTAAAVIQDGFQVSGTAAVLAITICAMCGVAVRLYLCSALILQHPDIDTKFPRLFPALWLLDSVWSASPLLLLDKLGIGVALGCVAVLAYLPFSQKTLMANASLQNPWAS